MYGFTPAPFAITSQNGEQATRTEELALLDLALVLSTQKLAQKNLTNLTAFSLPVNSLVLLARPRRDNKMAFLGAVLSMCTRIMVIKLRL